MYTVLEGDFSALRKKEEVIRALNGVPATLHGDRTSKEWDPGWAKGRGFGRDLESWDFVK